MSVSQDATAGRVTIGSNAATFELWRWGARDEPIKNPQAYYYPKKMNKGDGMRWLLTEAPEAQIADLLLISFDRDYPQPESLCFQNELSLCEYLTIKDSSSIKKSSSSSSELSSSSVSPWVTVLASSIRWCMLNTIKVPQVAGIKALDDCFAGSERMISKGLGKVSSDWYQLASDRCLVASLQREVELKGGLGSSALSVAHILRQKGDGKKTQLSLTKQPSNVKNFADKYAKYMRVRKSDPSAHC